MNDHPYLQRGIIAKQLTRVREVIEIEFFKCLYFTSGAKWNLLNLPRHLQGLPNHILTSISFVYYSLKCTCSSSYKFLKENVIYDPYLSQEMKKIIQKPYFSSTRQTQSYARLSFVCFLKCIWSSSDKPYMTEKGHFSTSYEPRQQNKNSESLQHICKTCPIISQSVKCLLLTMQMYFK